MPQDRDFYLEADREPDGDLPGWESPVLINPGEFNFGHGPGEEW
ncbi:hypothetical protein [Saccharopolyspora phatthalungensis]|uniref:Uncharacterized protein n=1 Tax=Saccharopolyspora phatthalungensis TaxID=664693 RepID=A0A840QJ79_9PSEU|nr:hypothetical protein [Saccharopolyspora phatthalungensis]MBB5159118.1 hypothetical protein [Saccharopolyspora phatthalungensis]